MKVHYINILLFALPLNILAHNKNKAFITPRHTHTTRLLCECDLYIPNYDNDPQMKEVMKNFNKQTQERFHEYDERMIEKRKRCKDKCDKEIQKIVLKDKLEKELMDKFATLQTDIQSDAIPTCICEKSLADKVEKGCLKCAQNLGGIVAPYSGVLGEIAALALSGWKTAAIDAATKYATAKGLAFGKVAGDIKGMKIVTAELEQFYVKTLIPDLSEKISGIGHYTNITSLDGFIYGKYRAACSAGANSRVNRPMCEIFDRSFHIFKADGTPAPPGKVPITETLTDLVEEAKHGAEEAAKIATEKVTTAAIKANTEAIEAATTPYYTPIIASIVAIVVIILIMVIIYLILRYRRKKKMKKKLQYIKLLKE
ncbi:rifin PIR protein, putative [Plasmodium reichenowi]|uniref:Rifin PIR protein, putative n=1 Tax=Plasmodium reichenowi TaxID=5854 RepID=A0A2P9DCE0_PLARE|nr:rifin PIR protein, putative [Plasmodium reichenowi]